MRVDRFVTPTYAGNFKVTPEIIEKYKAWAAFERELNPEGASESTTMNGWQYVFGPADQDPDWLKLLKPSIAEIREEIKCVRAKTLWVVEYKPGGYQDPHFHNIGIANVMTVIMNLEGTGDLILQDPRQIAMAQGLGFADVITLEPGDWIAMPAYLIHNSRPCPANRTILVLDLYVESI